MTIAKKFMTKALLPAVADCEDTLQSARKLAGEMEVLDNPAFPSLNGWLWIRCVSKILGLTRVWEARMFENLRDVSEDPQRGEMHPRVDG